MTDDRHEFGTAALSAAVSAQGAELCVLDARAGRETRPLLWSAGPAWPRHSPVLFPIIGKLPQDRGVLDGRDIHLTQHGFARDMAFSWIERGTRSCALQLEADAQTRALFPSEFVLRLDYEISDDTLQVRYSLHNPDPHRTLHASLGAHPAFAWPQRAGVAQEAHRLVFEHAEPAPIRRVAGGLLQPDAVPSPVRGDTLPLDDALFAHDALIFEAPNSRSVRFLTPDGTGIAVSWTGFPSLGIWSKPGAGFLCIEPWQGHATPEGFSADFSDKPGLVHLAPGARFEASWSVRPVSAA